MPAYTTPEVEGTGSALDERDVRALTEYLTVLDDVGRARNADDLYLVVSGTAGDEYLVDFREGRCECPDYQFRGARCKHIRRVAYETGAETVPAAYVDELPRDFGRHVTGQPRILLEDGGASAAA